MGLLARRVPAGHGGGIADQGALPLGGGLRHRRVGPCRLRGYAAPYQIATVFFAVIDLVAAVGLWLAAPWGAVVWLTSVISMAAVEILFPQVYGGSILVVLVEVSLLGGYLVLAMMAAREQPA